MSDNSMNKDKKDNAAETSSNKAVTAVEVVKGDTVVYEDGDFEDYNADKDYETEEQAKSDKKDAESKSDKNDKSDKDDKSKSEKADKSDADKESDKEDDSEKADKESSDDKEDDAGKEDKHGTTIASLYQWATKLKDDFMAGKEDKAESDKEEKSDDSDDKEEKSDKADSDKEDKHSTTIANLYQLATKLKDDFASEASNLTHDVSEKAVALMLNRLLDAADAELQAFDKKAEESKESDTDEERSKIADKKDKYQSMIDLLQG